MPNQDQNATFANNVRLSKNKSSLVLTDEAGRVTIINANLAKFHLEIPYIKKDGTSVTLDEILQKKELGQKHYRAKSKLA